MEIFREKQQWQPDHYGGPEVKTYEAGLKKLKETLDCAKLQYLSPELRRANLDYAEGIAFVLDIKIDFEKMEVME